MVLEHESALRNGAEDESARSLVQHLCHDVLSLAALELQLTRLELVKKATMAAKGAVQLGVAAVIGLVALLALALAIVAVLSAYMPLWGAALIVAALCGIVTLILVSSARAALAKTAAFSGAHTARRVLRPASTGESIGAVETRLELTRTRIEEALNSLEHKTDLLPPLRDTAVSLGSLGATINAIVRQTREPQQPV